MRKVEFGSLLLMLGLLALAFAGYGFYRSYLGSETLSYVPLDKGTPLAGASLELRTPGRILAGQTTGISLHYKAFNANPAAPEPVIVEAAAENGKLNPSEPIRIELGTEDVELMAWTLEPSAPGPIKGTVILNFVNNPGARAGLPFEVAVGQELGMNYHQLRVSSLIFLVLGLVSLGLGWYLRGQKRQEEAG